MNAADQAEVKQLLRSELRLLQRESLPANLVTKLHQANELRAVERFNVASRTLLTLDDVPPAAGQVLGVDANGFAIFQSLPSVLGLGEVAQQQLLNGATLAGLPRCNMVREAIRDDVPAFSTGVMALTAIELEAGRVINRIAILNGASAGSAITHSWAAIYTPGGVALGAQTPDVALGTTTANTLVEFTLAAPYTNPTAGLCPIGVMFRTTLSPSAWGALLGNAIVARPTGATGVTFPFAAGTNGTLLTTTAPAGPLAITAWTNDFAVWVY